MPKKSAPPEIESWPDGINPYVEPERGAEIVASRRARAAELEKKHKGWGRAYLKALGL